MEDCESRNLNASTLGNYPILAKRLNDFGLHRGLSRCSDFNTDTLRDFALLGISPKNFSEDYRTASRMGVRLYGERAYHPAVNLGEHCRNYPIL